MKPRNTRVSIRCILSFLVILGALGVTAAAAEPRKMLSGHVPQVVVTLPSSGRLPGGTQLELAIGLALRHQEELNALLKGLYDPASAQYRHYLTPEQFTESFGPTTEDYERLIRFAQSNHFAVTGVHSDQLLLDVTASAQDIERAFQVSMRLYPHPTEGRSFHAPDVEPSVTADLRVSDISGLNNFIRPHPKSLRQKRTGRRPKNTSMEGSGPNGNLIGGDYRAAYAPGVTLTGAGQSVGLFEYDNYYPGDLTSYESQAGLTTPPPVEVVLLNRFDGSQSSGNGEVALDIEVAMSMAPGLSNIICYEAGMNTPANDILSVMATNTAIKQFSCSWDFGSNPRAAMDTLFQKFAAQGQSFFDASGDDGAYVGAVPRPDDDPYVTLVGGTTLNTSGPGGAWLSETTWNAPDLDEASAGGISTVYALPSWQTGVATTTNKASNSHRNVPDVAMVADNIFIVADNGQAETSGGTSAAAPLWAAFAALANQEASADGLPAVGFINPAIYALAKSTAYAAVLDDITSGNNTNGNVGYFAGPGYDLCTGLGSPTGGSLMDALVSPDGFVIVPGRGFTANGPSGGPFNIVSQNILLTNSGSGTIDWAVGETPEWLSISAAGGSVTAGSAANSLTVGLTAGANAMPAGVYTANVWFTNLTNMRAQLRQFTLQVEQDLVQDGGFESGDFAYWDITGVNATLDNFVDDGTYSDYFPNSGVYFAVLSQITSIARLSQALPTTAGLPYLISFWLANPPGQTPSQFIVEWDSTNATNMLFSQSNAGSFDWQQMQFLAMAPASTTLLAFDNRNVNGFFALDDVSVVPVPLPTIQSIQQVGETVEISWNALSGLTYQAQFSPTLSPPQWSNLGSPITAVSASGSVTEDISGGTQGFYRIVLVNEF